MLSLAAAICGVVVARLLLDGALYAVIITLPPEIAQFMSLFHLTAPTSDWRVLMFLVVGAIASTVFFGLAPALQATRVDLVPAMHGELTRGASARRRACADRHAGRRIGAPVGLCRRFLCAAPSPPRRRIRMFGATCSRISLETESRRGALLQALRSDPLVEAIAASSPATRGVVSPSVPAQAGASSFPVYPERPCHLNTSLCWASTS